MRVLRGASWIDTADGSANHKAHVTTRWGWAGPRRVLQRFLLGWVHWEGRVILKDVCLFLLHFSEVQLGKHTSRNAFLMAPRIPSST